MNIRNKKISIEMPRTTKLLSIPLALLISSNLIAQVETPKESVKKSEKVLDVYENYGDLVLVEKNKVTKFITPKDIHANGSYVVRIKKIDDANNSIDEKTASQEEKIEARRIMFQANQEFFNGNLDKAWDLIEQAEKLDKDFYRIKSMKGSLLYRIGSKDLAVAMWQESLALNPAQPEIVKMLQETQKELGL
ncbi:MAG: hypothetical protein KBD78_06080 [Oligoflexales bacterium]|nr:hypothetical protein [Oligoflexales bacterium]